MPTPPRIHLVLAQNVAEKLPFQKLCIREDCPDKDVKACPHSLVINGKPVWKYADFFRIYHSRRQGLLNPWLSRAVIGDQKMGLPEYLIFFAEKCEFHKNASAFMKTICFNPVYSSHVENS